MINFSQYCAWHSIGNYKEVLCVCVRARLRAFFRGKIDQFSRTVVSNSLRPPCVGVCVCARAFFQGKIDQFSRTVVSNSLQPHEL